MRSIERELQLVLDRVQDARARGLDTRDIIPSLIPGFATLRRPCTCNLRAGSLVILTTAQENQMWMPGALHHHRLEIGQALWRAWMADLGHTEERFRV